MILSSALLLSGCAQTDAFHSKDLPEPLRPRKDIPTLGSGPPSTPYQALDWRLDER